MSKVHLQMWQQLGLWLVQPENRSVRILVLFFIGSLLGIGFVFPITWWLGLLAIPLLLEHVRRTKTMWGAGVSGWLMLSVSSLWSLSWFWSVLPLDWIPVGGVFSQVLLVGIYWMTTSIAVGMSGFLIAVTWWYIANVWSEQFWWLTPVVWLFGEVVGSMFFSLVTWQQNITLTPNFSFGYRGYLLAEHTWFFEVASIAGVYSLSLVAVAISYGGYKLFTTITRPVFYTILFIVVGLNWVPVPDRSTQTSSPISVAVVETLFSSTYRQTVAIDTILDQAIEVASASGASHILLPEDMRYFTDRLDSPLLPILSRLRWGTSSVTIIDSGRVATPAGAVLRGVIYENQTKKWWLTDKQYLVPQGEFLPALHTKVLQSVGYTSNLEELRNIFNYVPGPQKTQNFANSTPGLLFCFEGVAPWRVRTLLAEREASPPFIAHPISHAWFHDPTILWHQLDMMLRIQARWNNVAIVSAGNLSPSAVYDANGKINRQPIEVVNIHELVQVKFFTL